MSDNSSKFIGSIWSSADDQISSQYRLSVEADSVSNAPRKKGALLNNSSLLSPTTTNSWIFRLDKSFTLPTQTTSTYDVVFNGLKIPRVSAKEDTEKKIKLDFRCDQASDVYIFFKEWIDAGYDPLNGYMESEEDTRINRHIKLELLNRSAVKTTNGDENTLVNTTKRGFVSIPQVSRTFRFYHVQPFEINLTEFSHDNGDPVRVDLQFVYLYYKIE
jgi:hypothetical protein